MVDFVVMTVNYRADTAQGSSPTPRDLGHVGGFVLYQACISLSSSLFLFPFSFPIDRFSFCLVFSVVRLIQLDI